MHWMTVVVWAFSQPGKHCRVLSKKQKGWVFAIKKWGECWGWKIWIIDKVLILYKRRFCTYNMWWDVVFSQVVISPIKKENTRMCHPQTLPYNIWKKSKNRMRKGKNIYKIILSLPQQTPHHHHHLLGFRVGMLCLKKRHPPTPIPSCIPQESDSMEPLGNLLMCLLLPSLPDLQPRNSTAEIYILM